jgi:predicted transcriptional regulator
MNVRSGDLVIVYETSPTSMVVGQFTVGRVIIGPPSELAAYAETGVVERVSAYLIGARMATAIEALNPTRFETAISLDSFSPGLRAPQSYFFLLR